MIRKSFLIGAWIILILVGAYVNQYVVNITAYPASTWIAANSMPVNHQLKNTDLKLPENADDSLMPKKEDLVGRYLIETKNQGDPVEEKDLSLTPDLSVLADDMGVILFPLTGDHVVFVAILDVGYQILLCTSEPDADQSLEVGSDNEEKNYCYVQALEIFAIHRETVAFPHNWLLLKIPLANVEAVAEFVSVRKPFIVLVRTTLDQ